MALHVQVLDLMTTRYGGMTPAPKAQLEGGGGQLVGLGAQSTVIAGPCLLKLSANEDTRYVITRTSGYAAPGAAVSPLFAKDVDWRELPAGNFYVNAVAL